jgi:glucose-6-phosphate 1-epimerase
MSAIAELQSRFGIPDALRFDAGPGGLVHAQIATPFAQAHVHLHGAHITHYQPAGQAPLLFLSRSSRWEPGQPIRGGVPVIFPWFGPHPNDPRAPLHGLARLRTWKLTATGQDDDGAVRLRLELASDADTLRAWPHAYHIAFTVRVGRTLEMKLAVANPTDAAIEFEEALHTYLAVGDARRVTVTGLAGAAYIDKLDGFRRKQQTDDPLRIEGETDRVYLDTTAACEVRDPVAGRRIRISKSGSASTVIWNPWIAKARSLADFGDEEWTAMLCVETANVADNKISLPPGHTHCIQAALHAIPLDAPG